MQMQREMQDQMQNQITDHYKNVNPDIAADAFIALASGQKTNEKAEAILAQAKKEEKQAEIHWLTISEYTGLAQEKLAHVGPVLVFDKGISVYSYGSGILSSLVLEPKEDVSYTHDNDWSKFPEIYEGLKSKGVKESVYCVAKCPIMGKWAVGIANGWKGRETAAKLALCVAIAAPSPEMRAFVLQDTQCLEFDHLCATMHTDESVTKAVQVAKKHAGTSFKTYIRSR